MSKVLVSESNLTAIADAIRAKNGGSDTYTPSQMAAAIAEIETGGASIPEAYVLDEALRLVRLVQSHAVSNGFSFLLASDIHVDHNNAQLAESALHMAQGMAVAARYLDLDFVGHLGDLTTGAATTTLADGTADIALINREIEDAMTYAGLPQLRTVGNHDPLGYSYSQNGEMLTAAELYERFGAYNTGAVYGSETNCNYCYRDFTAKKVRVILLDTSQQTADSLHTSTVTMTAAQYQFFADALAGVGSKSDAAEWGVIVLSHMPPDWPDHNGFRYLSFILKAYLDGASGSYGGAACAFSGKNGARFIGWFHGHVHCYKTDKIHYASGGNIAELDAYKLALPNACFNRNNEYGATARWNVVYGEETTYAKTAQSASDTAFCVVTVDLGKGKIYADHYGAGYDREASYVAALYSVTVGDVGKATVTAPASVEEGEAFTATVTVSGNYSIQSVTVTMGGTAVSGAYSNGMISIPAVTGNIVITAVTSGYENVIDTVGCTDGYRLSTSKGTLSAGTGMTTTGFVDLTPYVDKGVDVIIRTKGVVFNNATKSNCIVCFYKADQTFVAGSYLNTSFSYLGASLTYDSSDNMVLTIPGTSNILKSNYDRAVLRFSGSGSGANLILTINEEIA